MTGEQQNDERKGLPGWLGKRLRDASSDEGKEDEPLLRKARSQEEQPHRETVTDDGNKLKSEDAAAVIPSSSSWPCDSNKQRPMAERLSDYLAEGGVRQWSPRPEWYRPRVTRKRLREASSPTPTAERLLPQFARVAAAAAVAQEAEHQVQAPEDGLLPEDAFVNFLQHHDIPPAQPPAANHAVAPDAAAAAGNGEAVADPSVKPTDVKFALESHYLEPTVATFGRDCDSALHAAVRNMAVEAALELIHLGASVHFENTKAVTPLLLACHKGSLVLAQELYKRGASLQQASHTGSTPLIQAAHFGHFDVVKFLLENGASLEKANNHNTTPLMRAAQEGHFEIVSLLLKHGAEVNRRNNEQMSALMLASQRGHADIVQLLIDKDAQLNATTQQNSTALMLACKRGNAAVVKILVEEGCEICIRDSRGRTAKDLAIRRNVKEFIQLLDPDVQVKLMQRKARVQRNHTMIQVWTLLQQDRAHVPLMHKDVSIHQVGKDLLTNKGSVSALIRTMTLPAPLVELVASFMPLPRLWDKQSALIMKKCTVDPDAAITSSLEIIDEVLDEGGFVEACDAARVTPPTNFSSWHEWKRWGHQFKDDDSSFSATDNAPQRRNVTLATLPGLPQFDTSTGSLPSGTLERPSEPYVQQRRGICFLQLLAHRTTLLGRILSLPPYNMPASLIQQLITVSDIQSLSRRMGSQGVHFDASVAIEMLMLVNTVCAWFGGARSDDNQVLGSPAQYSAYSSSENGSPNSSASVVQGDVERIIVEAASGDVLL